jgi:hypothetical protein
MDILIGFMIMGTLAPIVMNSLAWIGKWKILAKEYPLRKKVRTRSHWFQSCVLSRRVTYASTLIISTTSTDLNLSILPGFNMGHKPVSVPWADISAKFSSGRLTRYTELHFRKCPDVSMLITERLYEKIRDESLAMRG